ncbi:MAG: bifunctional metallophosphatase/5'-nucleotidase [Polyangiales bacterium]
MRFSRVVALASLVLPFFTAPLARAVPPEPAHVLVLGFNDFHGQLVAGKEMLERPAGSAPVLAAYLRDEMANFRGGSLIVHAGDFVGGSPLVSSLLQDEPAIAFLNLLGNQACWDGVLARCNVVGTLGNHEFDEGVPELLRLLRGGPAPSGAFSLDPSWGGARVPYVSANVVDRKSGKPLLPAYTVVESDGVRVGVIGAVLTATQRMVLAEGIRSVKFVDEAVAINQAARALEARGVRAIVVLLHLGAGMVPYPGPTTKDAVLPAESEIAELVKKLDGSIDVVVSGHAHQFTNAYAKGRGGREILVTQAHVASTAYAAITLTIDRKRGEVLEKSARIVPTFADEGPGLRPAEDVSALVTRAEQRTQMLLAREVGTAPKSLRSLPNDAGESELGNLVADAQRRAGGAQIALVSQGALRGDLHAGLVSWRDLETIHPWGNAVVTVALTGAQIRAALEQQWAFSPPHQLQVAGLDYKWDAGLPVGKRIISLRVDGRPIVDTKVYKVALSDHLARGGAGFDTLAVGKDRKVGPRDTEALRAHLEASGGRAEARIESRIVKRD